MRQNELIGSEEDDNPLTLLGRIAALEATLTASDGLEDMLDELKN
jgi:hypothetical protein